MARTREAIAQGRFAGFAEDVQRRYRASGDTDED
jgi:hypothetical protein